MNEPTTRHCHGCDSEQDGVRTYLGCFGEDAQWERVDYCPDCYDLAQCNWNGETHGIVPVSDRTNASFHDRMAAGLRSETVKKAAKGQWKDGLETRAKAAEARAAALRGS